MEAYISKDTVNLSVANLKEFNELVVSAQKQADELQQTLRRLEHFNIQFEFKIT